MILLNCIKSQSRKPHKISVGNIGTKLDNHMNMIDWRYMSDKSDIWGQMGFGDRQTFLILESLLQKKFCLTPGTDSCKTNPENI